MNKLNKFLVLQNKLRLALTILFLGSVFQIKAQEQERIPFDQGTKYILADVEVIGKISYNQQTVVTFAGLEKKSLMQSKNLENLVFLAKLIFM